MDTHASQNMLGRYRMLRLLGRGGMGEVWLAEDTQLLRQVAIKVLPSVLAADRGYLEDFAREARAAAALEHPHILPVHDSGEQQMGEDEVIPYLVTPYMSGGSLRERILDAQGPLPPVEAIGYLRQAAQAIDYAHSQHVLHRDIKPANMLLEQAWLFLADFGLAKLLTSTTQRSRTYAGSGTPEYMAPEQAHGKAEAASDRYSFAMTAYQLITGHVPFRGDTPYSTLIMQMTAEPPAPRNFNPELPEAVEQAILWGLAKTPADRPPSCMALVHALEHGWQMQALPQLDAEATMLSPWNTHAMEDSSPAVQPPASSGTPSAQPALTPRLPLTNPSMATGPSANIQAETPRLYRANDPTYISERGESGVAERARQAERQPGKITRRAVLAGAATAAVAVAAGGTALFLHSHFTPTQGEQRVSRPPAGPKRLIAGIPLLSLVGHTQPVRVARWSPNGRYLATGGEDASVMLWDIGGNVQSSSNGIQSLSKPLRSWKLPENILASSLCWSADGSTLAAVTGSNKVYLMTASVSGSTPAIYQDNNANGGAAYTAITWSPVANSFATPAYVQQQTQQVVDIWRVGHTTAPAQTLTSTATDTARTAIIDVVHPFNATAPLNALSWSTDGSLLAAHTSFGSVTIWQAATGAIKETLSLPLRPTKDHPLYVLNECLAWSPLKANLLAVSNIDLATLWDIQQNRQLLALKSTDPVPSLTGITWSPNGSYLAGSYAGSPRIYVWDVQKLPSGTSANQTTAQSQKLFFPQPGTHVHTATITDVAWSPDGRYIATASGDTTAVVWRVDAF